MAEKMPWEKHVLMGWMSQDFLICIPYTQNELNWRKPSAMAVNSVLAKRQMWVIGQALTLVGLSCLRIFTVLLKTCIKYNLRS